MLCAAVKKHGGLPPLLTKYSGELERQWRRLRPRTRVAHAQWRSHTLVDLHAANQTFKGEELGNAAEPAHQKMTAAIVPQMEVRIGPEAMRDAILSFCDAWSDLSPAAGRIAASLEMRNSDECGLGRRRYAVRTRLDGQPPEKTLDDLRGFLTLQAANDRMTLASFVETTSEEIAVWAVGVEGFGTDMRTVDTWLGRLSLAEIRDFIPLQLEAESYGLNTLWHVPLDTAYKYGFPNVPLGLHGVVLRSLPMFSPEFLTSVVKDGLKRGFVVYIRPITLTDLHVNAIVVEWIGPHGPYHLHSAKLPTFAACLGNATEARQVFDAIKGLDPGRKRGLFRRKEPALRFGSDDDPEHKHKLVALLHIAYNLDVLAYAATPEVRVVPADISEGE